VQSGTELVWFFLHAEGDEMIEVKPRGIAYKGAHCSVLFFGESPGREEAEQGTAFVGPSGRHIQEVIEGLIPGVSCVLDNVCPLYMNGGKPKKKELDQYADYRAQAIARFQPKVIVALGAIALKALGIKASPTKHCGGIFSSENSGALVGNRGCPIVASIHPAYILRDPTQIGLWQRVFAGVRSCLRPTPLDNRRGDARRIEQLAELRRWLSKRAGKLCSFDLETSSLDPKEGKILCCAICDGKETIWVPLFHKDFTFVETKVTKGSWSTAVILWQEVEKWWSQGPRIVHNMKFELAWMRHRECSDPPRVYDTMLQAWLLDENQPKGLDHLVTSELGHPPYWLDLPSEGSYADVPLEKLGAYNALDAKYTFELHTLQRGKLGKVRCKLADGLVSPLAALLVSMEERGVHVDLKRLEATTTRMRSLATHRLGEMTRAFPGVNFSSPKQLRELVFGKLGLKPIAYTDGGKSGKRLPSVKGEILGKLARQEPRLAKLAEARKVKSLINRVLEPWREAADDQLNDPHKAFIHTTFGLGNVVTGRLSSSNPNLQNIDRTSEKIPWKGIQRQALTSRFKNGVIIQLDQKQGELRVQAAVAGDEKFLDAFRSGADPHQMTADELGCDRSKAKNINFSIIYLITGRGLQERYGIQEREGQSLIERWYKLHPQIREYQERCFAQVKELGYVESIFGWRRHLSDMENEHERSQAVNFPIQNACVVITYLGMLAVEHMLKMGKHKSVLVHQVHDSIVLDCPKSEAKSVAKKAKHLMEHLDLHPWVGKRLRSPIPLGVDVKVGEHL